MAGLSLKKEVLVNYMKIKDLSERSLADIIGVDHTTLNRVLREERNPGPKFVAGILKNTDITFDELFDINGSANN